MTVTEQLHNEIEQLPEPLAREVLDFLRFIRFQHSKTEAHSQPEKTAKDLYVYFEKTGMIGCIEAEEDLSEDYKQQLWK